MNGHEKIQASGIVPPLRNPEAEKCAQEIAAVIHDKVARQAVFVAYRDTHPGLKNWEAQAIGQRAMCIARNSPEISARVLAASKNA